MRVCVHVCVLCAVYMFAACVAYEYMWYRYVLCTCMCVCMHTPMARLECKGQRKTSDVMLYYSLPYSFVIRSLAEQS